MVIAIFGESCTGKSAIAMELTKRVAAKVYAGKDYLRMDSDPNKARAAFAEMLKSNVEGADVVIYLIAEREGLSLAPPGAMRVLVTADLDTIKARFAQRMSGYLPKSVSDMLERRHGMFDAEPCDLHIGNTDEPLKGVCDEILKART